ncbi:MAG: hypothetical protein AAF193_07675, partial [Bacteroidota bacterium]
MTEDNSTDFFEVELSSGTVLSTLSLTTTQGNISSVYGMARNPIDDVIYILYNAGNGIRGFGVLNPIDGVITVINGNINNYNYETMAFGDDGRCYAMTASNDDSPYLLREINITNGSSTTLSDLEDIEGFGQAIVFNYADNTIYRVEGGGNNTPFYWQSLNMNNYSVATQVTMPTQLDGNFPFSLAMCFQFDNSFLLVDDNTVYEVNTSGVISNPRPFNVSGARISGIVLSNDNDDTNFGCTDSNACNYDATASLDDGSCIVPVENCTVCNADNSGLDLIDTDGDGVCDAEEILGCTNPNACNFSIEATQDDNSCVLGIVLIPETPGTGPAVLSCCIPGPESYEIAVQSCAQLVIENN